jgi:hypothetical protein
MGSGLGTGGSGRVSSNADFRTADRPMDSQSISLSLVITVMLLSSLGRLLQTQLQREICVRYSYNLLLRGEPNRAEPRLDLAVDLRKFREKSSDRT